MKARLLKKLLNTERFIADYGVYVGIGSSMVHNLINIDKETQEIGYALDTFHKGRASMDNIELEGIWDALHELKASGVLRDIIFGVDEIENPVTVYFVENGEIVKTTTDKYEFPNVTVDGKRMYKDAHFLTEQEAIEAGIELSEYHIKVYQEQLDRLLKDVNLKQKDISEHNWFIKNLNSLKSKQPA